MNDVDDDDGVQISLCKCSSYRCNYISNDFVYKLPPEGLSEIQLEIQYLFEHNNTV